MQPPGDQPADRSAAELLRQVSEQTQRLVRQEIALARLEVADKLRHAGIGAGLLGAAAGAALFATGALVTALILALATAVAAWLAALIVAVALLAGAAALALAGRAQLRRATPPAPEQAIESVRADVEEVRAHAHR